MEEIIKSCENSKTKLSNLLKFAKSEGLDELSKLTKLRLDELYPESEEIKSIKERSKELNLLFRSVGLNFSYDTAYLIEQAVLRYNKLGDKYSIKDSTDLIVEVQKIFEL